jgi:hypothetical protein
MGSHTHTVPSGEFSPGNLPILTGKDAAAAIVLEGEAQISIESSFLQGVKRCEERREHRFELKPMTILLVAEDGMNR